MRHSWLRSPVRCNNPLGIIIYEMLAGAAPFHAKAAMAFMRQHMVAEPPDLRTRVPQVSKELHELVHAMLAKEPQARPDMTQVMDQLRRIMGGSPSRMGDTLVVENDVPNLPERRTTLLWLGGAGLGILLLLGLLWAFFGRKVPPPEPVTPKVEATSLSAPPLQPRTTTPEVQPALDMARLDAKSSPPPPTPPSETQDAGGSSDALPHDAAEPEPSQRVEPEPSPPPVEPVEPPPSPISLAPTHVMPAKGKKPGKTTPSHSDTRHRNTKQRTKHGRSR